ncbi:hypothetical protein GOBAR_DD09428 [Gossypium barbadense]|nr:hypothetical protein GOBAR_DD09428 [Gossypium barbadense]
MVKKFIIPRRSHGRSYKMVQQSDLQISVKEVQKLKAFLWLLRNFLRNLIGGFKRGNGEQQLEAERSSPVRAFDMQNSISTALKDMQKQLNHISKYDWDFDNYLEEDVPAAIEYIKDKNETNNGKLLAIGHSMGGILLYAMLSRCGYEGKDSGLAAVTTLASSLDYTSSRSSLKLLLPLASADPAQVLNVPVIPIGTLLAAAHPFAANPPYLLSWLSPQISAPDMLQPKLFEKLVTENFDFGIDAFNCHIAHYDIVGAQWAVDLVYPCIIEFLNHHDAA